MTHILKILLIPIFSTLLACGQATPSENGQPGPQGELLQPWLGDLDDMRARRLVRVLTVYSVGNYYIDQGQEKGLVKELAQLLEKFLNREVKGAANQVHVAIVPVARDQLLPALLAGRGDLVMASLSITPEREQIIDFSIPISGPVSEILVTGPSAPPLASIADLAGKAVYVRQSSSYRESLEQLNLVSAGSGLDPVRIELVDESLEDEDLIEMVDAGLLPWAIIDDYKLTMWNDVFTHLEPRPDIVFREGARIAWAFRQDSPQLATAVNTFVEKNRAGTLVGNVLIKRYITDFDWSKNALSPGDYALFKKLTPVFQKYGEAYDIDYLLAVAQGYQESRLDQSARGPTGAIGIMQILPATAQDPNVDIDNIKQAENNIQAGMKYLDYLRSRYFSDPGMDRTNRTLMALAAYNVGPARMIELRGKAEQQGYDPDIWFDNVELVAAKEIGRGPVQYVANIVKYYTAYRNAITTLAARESAREEAGIE